MSEVDVHGQILSSFTGVKWPDHLWLDSERHVLVADCRGNCVHLLNSQLQLQRALVDRNSPVKMWKPERLCYNEITSQLYVAHSDDVISLFLLR